MSGIQWWLIIQSQLRRRNRTVRRANIYGSSERRFFSDNAGISQNALVIMLKKQPNYFFLGKIFGCLTKKI